MWFHDKSARATDTSEAARMNSLRDTVIARESVDRI